MTKENHTPEPPEGGIPTDRRPLGYWLRVVDHLISREFATAFAEEDVSRRDWMLLNALSGEADFAGLADRLARRGKRLRALADRGWADEIDGSWQLTDEGRAAHARLSALVQSVREKVANAVSPEDFATMTASLQAIARQLGWDENERMPRGRRFGRGRPFGPGFRPGFGPNGPFGHGRPFGPGGERQPHGFGPDEHGFGPEGGHRFGPGQRGFGPGRHADGCPGGHHPAHPHHRRGKHAGRKAERAFERGFAAGFRAANSADGAADAASPSAV
ncbi:MAG: hypothetical protein QM611_08815 [Microbacterium sp.]|uniref:MarR family winged helix-turn-helix transcriptional regulator n=1 Tax=Microbacterium sp. TaxID=51671 RepID=UPI0039E5CA0B